MDIKIAPSILSADFCRLGEDVKSISTADYIHFDVMDGVFVPNISVGIPVLESLRKNTEMVIDAHLMITEPVRYVEQFARSGADIIVVHVEADSEENIAEAVRRIKAMGKRAGLSVKPKTPASAVLPFMKELDMVLVMTVEPGFGGQSFMHDQLPKIAELRRFIDENGLDCELEVDGGINPETAKLCVESGANVLVAGSDIFKAPDRSARIRELRGL